MTDYVSTIEQTSRDFGTAFDNADAAALANIYMEGGMLLPPNHEAVTGNDNIQAFWQGAIDAGITAATLETTELDKSGDTIVEVGKFVLKAGDNIADQGKYIVIWKQENGTWKYYRDIWNSSVAA